MNTVFKRNGKVKRHLLCEHAYTELKSAVVNGWFKADERLVETKLAEIMGISRTPLREAIHKLEREGLVYKLPTGGHAVNSASEEDIRETRGVAGILLGYAAYLATSRVTENDLNLLRRITRQSENHLAKGNPQELVRAWERFCNTLLLLSGNNRLATLYNGLKENVSGQPSRLRDLQRVRAFLDGQRALIDLMEARQAARAEKLARAIVAGNVSGTGENRSVSKWPRSSARRLAPTG